MRSTVMSLAIALFSVGSLPAAEPTKLAGKDASPLADGASGKGFVRDHRLLKTHCGFFRVDQFFFIQHCCAKWPIKVGHFFFKRFLPVELLFSPL